MLEFAHQEHVKSYYLDSRNQTFELPPLTQQEETDVCVIGAGFFGLSAALELAEKGKKVAMVCSGGADTPTGYFSTPVASSWRLLMGPSYGQYATRIYSSYLFHSVPYYSQHKDDVEYDEFNKLGTIASLGCIRLAVVDVKWIYDNCPLGTPVVIYNDKENHGPMGKPGTIDTDPADTEKRGWDPTDPDPANPWDDSFESGTAIRSQAAWDQWEDERENWMSSLTPTDLQGWSTDSKIEGTRG